MTLFTPQPFRGSPIVLLHYSTRWTGKFCSTASQFNHTANLTFHSSFTSISFNLLHMLLPVDSLLSNCSSLGHLFSQTVWPSLPSPPVLTNTWNLFSSFSSLWFGHYGYFGFPPYSALEGECWKH